MKSLVKVTCTAFILTSLMAACNEQTTSTKQEETNHKVEAATQSKKSKEMSEEERLEKGILLYGQSSKGGYYGATVENAKYEKADKTGYITARITINNVREDQKTIDLSEIKYSVKDEKTGKTYKGQAMPMYEDKFKTVPAGYSLTFEVSFMMEKPPKDLNNMYLYMDSKVDPFTDTHWKLDNLVSK
ncbi:MULTISPECIES: hypothetical protein [Priestia]|uniref:hypothetical protein n=1 Tax=Priestia TaxID=2800373 RepID=UPI00300AD10A